MRMEAGAPFLVVLTPPLVLGQWKYTLYPHSLMWPQLPPLPLKLGPGQNSQTG